MNAAVAVETPLAMNIALTVVPANIVPKLTQCRTHKSVDFGGQPLEARDLWRESEKNILIDYIKLLSIPESYTGNFAGRVRF
jgi:hypothetical protein